jgi:hypothetical protein
MRAAVLIALLIVVLLFVGGGGVKVVKKAAEKATGGKRVTNAPAGADGIVRVAPGELARQAGVPLAVYALARMLRSEHGSEGEKVKTAIGWAAVNYARQSGVTIDRLLTRGTAKGGSDGFFGAQNVGKYASTRSDPTTVDIEIARKVLNRQVPDPTGGATQFDSPAAQRALVKKSLKGYSKGPEEVAAERMKKSDPVIVAGIDPDHLRFWRPRGAA